MNPKRNPPPEDGVAWLVVLFLFVALAAMAVGAWCDYHYDPSNAR